MNFNPARLIAHARLPLYRNAYAWMVSTVISSGLGILYWLLAGRFYGTEIVGVSAALISAMILLSGISQFNLMSALIRYIPEAGTATSRLVVYAYTVSILSAALISSLIIVVFRSWEAAWSPVKISPHFELWAILSTITWSIFNLQDSVLTGLRDAVWVPVENIVFAVGKIVLLVLFKESMPQYGVFTSWMIPVLLVILPVNILIFRRLIPQHVRATAGSTTPLIPAEVIKYTLANYVGSLFLLASTRLIPVFVTHQAGAQMGAYFFLPWTIANSLKLVATNMAMSLTVEGVRDQTQFQPRGRRFLLTLAGILIPVIIILIVCAPYLLRLAGSGYSVVGTALFRLLVLSVIPAILTAVAISVARVQNATTIIAATQGLFCGLVLALSSLWLKPHGIAGVGYAFLASETIVATIFILKDLNMRFKNKSTQDKPQGIKIDQLIHIKRVLTKITPPVARRRLLMLRDQALDATIRYRQKTGWKGALPDFLIIGTQKGGTTYLYDELCRHPAIFSALSKEIHFFDTNFEKGLNWYKAFFQGSPTNRSGYKEPFMTGEASPSYLFHPLAAQRIYELMPNVKLIAMLRSPVQRAYSHYHHEVRLGYEPLSFEEAIEKEEERLLGRSNGMRVEKAHNGNNFMHYSYLSRGIYIDQLRFWRRFFPPDQLLIIKSEDFFKDSQAVIKQVIAFLGLPDWVPVELGRPKSFEYPAMLPSAKQFLIDYFKPHNQALYQYLGINYGWNE